MAHRTGRLPTVAESSIAGVRVQRHVLDLEASSLAHTMRRLGFRIKHWLRVTTDDKTMPDELVLEAFKQYTNGVLGLLKEQRERAKLVGKAGGPPLTDEEYEAELEKLRAETLATMTTAELENTLRARKAIDSASPDSESRKKDI